MWGVEGSRIRQKLTGFCSATARNGLLCVHASVSTAGVCVLVSLQLVCAH